MRLAPGAFIADFGLVFDLSNTKVKSIFMKLWTKLCTLNQQCDHRKAFANLLISKERISVNFQIDSGSTCSILPVGFYKEISGDHDLQDLNTAFHPTLSIYDEKTKSQHRVQPCNWRRRDHSV